jgi:hypothetical protein
MLLIQPQLHLRNQDLLSTMPKPLHPLLLLQV